MAASRQQRLAHDAVADDSDNVVADHPLQIEPSFGTSEELQRRASGLGAFSLLGDDVLLVFLEYLDAGGLTRFAQCSQWTLAFSRFEGLWKRLVLKLAKRHASTFHGALPPFVTCWWDTYRSALATVRGATRPPSVLVATPAVRSNELYAPWYAHCLPLRSRWLARDNIPRISVKTTDNAAFSSTFEADNTPVIITDLVTTWPAYQKWSKEYLLAEYGDQAFTAGPAEMRFRDYLRYSEENLDDVPLYLFDKRFGEKAPGLAADYLPPPYFTDEKHDLFALLDPQVRPAYRWLVIGSARSGSRFHQDPNATSAWNAAVRGSKKWIMFPPTVTPPGVFPSKDGADVTSPLSLLEWFTGFYEEARATGEMKECILHEGELMFVPSRWWHLVINLDWSIAITQNFVSEHNLANVLHFLEHQPESVSGMLTDTVDRNSFFHNFSTCLSEKRPSLFAKIAEEKQHQEDYKQLADDWDTIANDPDGESFSFL